jgi:hypothetical protein
MSTCCLRGVTYPIAREGALHAACGVQKFAASRHLEPVCENSLAAKPSRVTWREGATASAHTSKRIKR